MSVPTVFLSAATLDLEEWRNVLDAAFRQAGFRVLTQGKSLGMPARDVRHLLVTNITQSDCIIHLAGMGYGSHASDVFPGDPGFQCSWTQFEYYHAHSLGMPVIAFVCTPDLSLPGFKEEGDDAERSRKSALQEAHRQRVSSGWFTGTPLAASVKRTVNSRVDSMKDLLIAVAGSVREVHGLGQAGASAADQLTFRSSLHQLPPRPTGFVGREADLVKLRAMPASGTVLTGLRGMGGIGKTALGLVLAHEWAAQFPDAQLFLDGRGTQESAPTAESLLARVINTFQPTTKLPEDLPSLHGIFTNMLQEKRVLLFLDNAKDAAQAKPLIPPTGCALIVTSRASILLGTTPPHDVGRLPDAEAAALLREFHPALTDADATELVKLCAGLPLALRLAGAHLAFDGPEPDVAGYLRALSSGRLKHLDAEAADAGEITISETLRLSEAQLSESERSAWRSLSVFTASFESQAAEVVAGADAAILTTLQRRSLLERKGTDRYKLHDLAADYAREKLSAEARTDLAMSHARHFTAVVEEAQSRYLAGDAMAALAIFDSERAQIEAAYAWLSSQSKKTSAHQIMALVDAVAHIGYLRFHPNQSLAWLESQLRAARIAKDKRYEGAGLCNLGIVYANLGDARRAIQFFEQALIVSKEIGDLEGECGALGNIGTSHLILGDAHKAIKYHGLQLAIAIKIGDRRGEGNALGNLGNVNIVLGDARQAFECYEHQMVIVREIGDPLGKANVLGNLGKAHDALGDARQAIEFYKQQLIIVRQIGDKRGEGAALSGLGIAHKKLGDTRQSLEFYEQALVLSREINERRGEGNALWNTALSHNQLGDRPEAIARADVALAIYEAIDDPNAAMVRSALAEWRGQS